MFATADASVADANPEIEKAFEWLVSTLPKGEWESRRMKIEAAISDMYETQEGIETAVLRKPEVAADKTAWYLFLVWTTLVNPKLTEETQAARVLPIFARLGQDLDQVKSLKGIDAQVSRLLTNCKSTPDSVLFEILIALLWSKNGFKEVEFLPVKPPDKSPDIRAANGNYEWFIETKRMSATSQYSERERETWHKFWNLLRSYLVKYDLPLILDIVFHVELAALEPTTLFDELEYKLPFVMSECEIISNENWTVTAKQVDFAAIREHLKRFSVKASSRQMHELIGGKWDRTRKLTYVMKATKRKIGDGIGFNTYIDDVEWAAGAYWSCTAERSVEAKARDIRSHIATAVEQIPDGRAGIIHVGLETFDGEAVEHERYTRILNTVANFHPGEKELFGVYVHLFETYAPPSHSWTIDETVYTFLNGTDPLANHNAVLPHDVRGIDGMHWLREPPA